MTKEEYRIELERRVEYAKRVGSTAPVATVLQDVIDDLEGLNFRSDGSSEQRDRMLTVKEAAKRLDMSEAWIYRKADSLPFVKRYPPRTLKISEQGLDRWLARRG